MGSKIFLGLVLIFWSFIIPLHTSFAQITLDGSLGPAASLTGPNYTIGSNLGQIRGGNLTIGADVFLASTDSTLFASSALKLLASITNIAGLLEPLPENIFEATSLLQQSCAARFSEGRSVVWLSPAG